jgi:hypothetical protein
MTHTYTCQLHSGAICTVKLNAKQLFHGKSPVVKATWDRKPLLSDLEQYKNWFMGIIQLAVDETNKCILYVIQEEKDLWIPYKFQPNKKPERLT